MPGNFSSRMTLVSFLGQLCGTRAAKFKLVNNSIVQSVSRIKFRCEIGGSSGNK
jgi:hypothetical protein